MDTELELVVPSETRQRCENHRETPECLSCTSGSGDVAHCDIPAQLGQGGGAEGRHALCGAGPSSHSGRVRTLQQPDGLQHQPAQYGQLSVLDDLLPQFP